MANWFERALATVAPAAAARRAAERRRFELIEGLRAYDGASRGRRLQHWLTQGTAADTEIATAAPTLRQRAHDLCRNNPIAARIPTAHADNIIGAGIVPRANTGKPELDKKINAAFDQWVKQASVEGTLDFYGLQHQAVHGMVEGGEMFAQRRIVKPPRDLILGKDEFFVPLKLELLEADHCDSAKNEQSGSGIIVNGIEYRNRARRGYWMFEQHPGASVKDPKASQQSVFVKASEVVHLFEPLRTQNRGVTWLAPVIVPLKELDEYNAAELIRKKIEACVVAVVVPGDVDDTAPLGNADTGVVDANGNPVERFEPGMIAYAHNGRDVKFSNPAISAGIEAYVRIHLRRIASGVRLPYPYLTTDTSQNNHSADRSAVQQYRRFVEHIQWHIFIAQFLVPIMGWWTEAARLVGVVDQNTVVAWEYSTPKNESINPVDDVKADLMEVRAGFRSMPDVIASRGRIASEVLTEIAETNAEIDRLDLTLDSDPRKVSINGQVQLGSGGNDAAGDDQPAPSTRVKGNAKAA